MNAALALVLVLLGQCGPGGCPSPARSPFMWSPLQFETPVVLPVQLQPAPVAQEPVVMPAPTRHYDWHRIRHEGLSFYVWGWQKPNGNIVWDDQLAENAREFQKARQQARDAVRAQAESEQARKTAEEQQAQEKAKTETEQKTEESRRPKAINYGIDPTKLAKNERYTMRSHEAAAFIQEAKSHDKNADRLYVTVIGAAADRKVVADDWAKNPAFDSFRNNVWFQEFDHGDWQVQDDLGFAATGKPTILVQKPNGEVLLRADHYTGPVPVIKALRRADPSYRPEKDPGPENLPDSLSSVDPAYLAIGAVVAALIFLPKRKKNL